MEEKHYKRIINQVSGYVREVCTQMTQTVPKAIVTCMVVQVCVLAGVVGVQAVEKPGMGVGWWLHCGDGGLLGSAGVWQQLIFKQGALSPAWQVYGPSFAGRQALWLSQCSASTLLQYAQVHQPRAPQGPSHITSTGHIAGSPSSRTCAHYPGLAPLLPPWQAKEKLLEEMSASVAGDQEASLKRLLGEDEQVMKRREVLTHKLDMLKRAQNELANVDV